MNDAAPPEPPPDDFHARYRRISAADPSRPSEAVRRAILARAAQLADGRRAPVERSPGRVRPVGRGQRWRRAVIGTLAAAALAGVLVVPRFIDNKAPPPAMDRQRTLTRQAPAPRALAPPAAALSAAAPAPKAAEAFAQHAQAQAESPAARGAAVRAAAASGDVPRLESLLLQRADLEARDPVGRTALMIAVQSGQRRAVEWLLSHGADPNATDLTGKTPLVAAREAGDSELVATLIRRGAH